MKKIILAMGVLVVLTACGSSSVVVKKDNKIESMRKEDKGDKPVALKKKLAISTFENKTSKQNSDIGKIGTDVLGTELVKSGRFILLERNDLDKVLAEVKFSQSGLTQGSLGDVKLLDADYIITGGITKYGTISQKNDKIIEVMVDLKLIDLRSGEVILADSGEGKVVATNASISDSLAADAFRAAVMKFMDNVVETLDKREWTSRVVKFSNGTIYLNAGQKSNLEIGTKLEIYTQGEAIADTDGRILGYEENLIGKAVVSGYFGDDGAKAVMDSGVSVPVPGIAKLAE